MKLIAIDSSTEACSVAIMQGAEILESWQLAPRQHTRLLLPMVDQLLAETGLALTQMDAMAYACGPGSFTGLRVCISAVQGLAFGAELPVVAVSSLASLAQSALDQQELPAQASIVAALDARMDEVYWSVYQPRGALVEAVAAENLTAPEQLLIDSAQSGNGVLGVGPGFSYRERFPCAGAFTAIQQELLPHASAVARLGAAAFSAGEFCRPEQATARYLRNEISWKKTALQGKG